MSRPATLIVLGILIFLSPFSGLPLSWLSWILPILGLGVLVSGLSLRQARVRAERRAAPSAVIAEEVIDIVEVE
jgi:hypothetical protein